MIKNEFSSDVSDSFVATKKETINVSDEDMKCVLLQRIGENNQAPKG